MGTVVDFGAERRSQRKPSLDGLSMLVAGDMLKVNRHNNLAAEQGVVRHLHGHRGHALAWSCVGLLCLFGFRGQAVK